jgi:hypothetical protein
MRQPAAVAALVLGALPFAAGAQAPEVSAREAATTAAPGQEQLLDEVVVRGTQLWKLRQRMKKTEDKFYALYNKLNKEQDFDVHCHIETPTGRVIKERICRVAFFEDAQEIEAKALLDGHSAPPAYMVAQARNADFEAHFLKVINSDPRLLKMVREREALGAQYSEELKRRYRNNTWFQFEK